MDEITAIASASILFCPPKVPAQPNAAPVTADGHMPAVDSNKEQTPALNNPAPTTPTMEMIHLMPRILAAGTGRCTRL